MTHQCFDLPDTIRTVEGKTFKGVEKVGSSALAIKFTDGTMMSFIPMGNSANPEVLVSLWGAE